MWVLFILLLIILLPEIIEVILSYLPDRHPLEQRWYVQARGNKAIFALIKSKDYAEVYKEKTVRGKIEVNEDKEIDEPVLRIFQHVPVFDCGVFIPVIAKTKYVFYVPKGTVLYLNSEKESSNVTNLQAV